ncbi:MAG: adenylyl cyclase, partial [Dermatophilaceae bacterium]
MSAAVLAAGAVVLATLTPAPAAAHAGAASTDVATSAVSTRATSSVVPADATSAGAVDPAAGTADLGPNVVVFDPSMPVAEIRAVFDRVYAQQVADEMGNNRWSLLFRPGTYGTAEEPLQVTVGYYTEVAGLGADPGDVRINGKVEVYNQCA